MGRSRCAIALFVSLAGGNARGLADSGAEALKSEMHELLHRLAVQEKELSDLKARYAELLRRVEQQSADSISASLAAGPPQMPASQVSARESGPKLLDRVQIGGYGSVRFEANNLPASPKSFTFRRFVITTDARITDRLQVYSELELERLWGIEVEKRAAPDAGGIGLTQAVEGNSGGEIALEQAWGQYNFAANHGIRAGVVLPPLGRFNILHDDDYWDLPRRTLVDRDAPVLPVKSAWRDLGAGLVGGFRAGDTGRIDYQVYLLNGSRLDFNLESVAQTRSPRRNKLALEGEFALASGFFDGSETSRALAWRAAFSPSLAGEFALSGYHGRYTPDYLDVKEPVNSLGFDYKWRRGAFEFEGEAIYTSMGRVRRVADSFARAFLRSAAETSSAEARELESEIEFELGSLSRTRLGFWTDFKYNWRPSFLKRTFLGRGFEDPRLIPILRYERVWLNRHLSELTFENGAVTGYNTDDLEQDRLSLGLSYRPVRNFGLMAAFERNRRVNGPLLVFPRVDAKATSGLVTGMVFAF